MRVAVPFRFIVGVSALTSVLAIQAANAQPLLYEVQLYGPLHPFEFATPFGMNELGRVVGYSAFDSFDPSATGVVIDPDTGLSALTLLDPNFNFPYAMNDLGAIVGQSGQQGFHWSQGVAAPLPVPGGFFSAVGHDIDNSGRIVGSFGDSDQTGPMHCFWPSGSVEPTLLPGLLPEVYAGSAWAINEAGQIAGVSGGFEGVFFAVRWDSATSQPVQIGPLPGAFNSEALGMNEEGDVVGRSSFFDFSIQAMYWHGQDGFLTGLGFLPGGNYSEAFDVNDASQVVGTAATADGNLHAYLWESNVMYDLNDYIVPGGPSFLYLSRAGSINNDGIIAAEAVIGETGFPRAIAILTPIVAADLNCDGSIDVADAIPLALALTDETTFTSAYPGCNPYRADVDGDGTRDGRDIQAFLDGLFND